MDNYAYQGDEATKEGQSPFTITRYPSVKRAPNDYLVEVNSRSKFFRNTKFHRTLSGVLFALVIILVLILLIVLILYCRKYYEVELCTSEECLHSAANLRLSLDLSKDPCDNFYEYTCGRWSKEHPNHGWFASFSAFSTINEKILIETESYLRSDNEANDPEPVKQARDFYKSCMDRKSIDDLGLSVIFKYLKEANLPPVPSIFTKTDDEIRDFKFDWIKSEATLKKMFAMDVIIGFAVDANTFNRSQNVMFIGVPGQACPLPSPLRKDNRRGHHQHRHSLGEQADMDEKRKEINSRLIKLILTTVIENATATPGLIDQQTLQLATDVLLNMTWFTSELISNYTFYNIYGYPHSVREYQSQISDHLSKSINQQHPDIWQKYLEYLFEGVDASIVIDYDKDFFYIANEEMGYLPKILEYAFTTSDVFMELYMWWVTVYAMIFNTSSGVVQDILNELNELYSGSDDSVIIRSRSLECGDLVKGFMGMAISYGIADKTFSNKTKPKVEQMLYEIKTAFVEHVSNNVHWMDKETKLATLEKSKEMVSFIGYPDWLFDKGSLAIYYKGIVVKNDTYLDNMMSFVKQYVPSKLANLRVENERNWTTDPITVNAFNSFEDNAIDVPMGILSFPIYNLGLEVLNYGAIGSVLGHELTHGFDNTGRKHDKFGNYKQWWTNETIETFEEKIACFVKQYDNFTINGRHVDGDKTLGENLADNGGLSHAYRAYQNFAKKFGSEARLPGFEGFSQNQLFFIAYASIWCETISTEDLAAQIDYDEHSPNNVRVVGTLQNTPEFARAFECPLGSKMNPSVERCKVW